jgi:formylglycine-generating enzyme required for sulfatase activity
VPQIEIKTKQEDKMKSRFSTFVLVFILWTSFSATAQTMNIHTPDGVHSYNLTDIDSITFGNPQEHQPGEERAFLLADSVEIVMVWIPAGDFQMGSPDNEQDRQGNEGPVHLVTFASGFWMGKYEVTQAQWAGVMENNPASDYGVGANYPVYNVSWNDIQEFESALGDSFHLPSEAEWEYACRAGTTTRFYWGEDANYSQIGTYAWYYDNSGETYQVGSKTANGWGLHDMSGNVYECCEDWYHYSYSGAPDDGSAWVAGEAGDFRVLRGGSWSLYARDCRSSTRHGYSLDFRGNGSFGFRLIRNAD